jgi:hypothetical protein
MQITYLSQSTLGPYSFLYDKHFPMNKFFHSSVSLYDRGSLQWDDVTHGCIKINTINKITTMLKHLSVLSISVED